MMPTDECVPTSPDYTKTDDEEADNESEDSGTASSDTIPYSPRSPNQSESGHDATEPDGHEDKSLSKNLDWTISAHRKGEDGNLECLLRKWSSGAELKQLCPHKLRVYLANWVFEEYQIPELPASDWNIVTHRKGEDSRCEFLLLKWTSVAEIEQFCPHKLLAYLVNLVVEEDQSVQPTSPRPHKVRRVDDSPIPYGKIFVKEIRAQTVSSVWDHPGIASDVSYDVLFIKKGHKLFPTRPEDRIFANRTFGRDVLELHEAYIVMAQMNPDHPLRACMKLDLEAQLQVPTYYGLEYAQDSQIAVLLKQEVPFKSDRAVLDYVLPVFDVSGNIIPNHRRVGVFFEGTKEEILRVLDIL